MRETEGVKGRWASLSVRDAAASAGEALAEERAESRRAHSGSYIGAGAVFEGTLKLQGDFHIDTEFRGELRTDGRIVVGPEGSVQGDIHAREVVVDGAVVGNIFARRQLTLRSSAQVHGDLETACLEVQPHAFFCGNTAMTRPQDGARARAPRPVTGAAAAPEAPAASVAAPQ